MVITTEFTSTLTALNGAGVVEISYMEADLKSARKIMNAVTGQQVDRENQDLFFLHISIKKEHANLFQRGKSDWIQSGNVYTLETVQRNPIRFKADLQTTVEHNNIVYVADIKLGSIDFDLSNAASEENGEEVLFENVPATLYPFGRYERVRH